MRPQPPLSVEPTTLPVQAQRAGWRWTADRQTWPPAITICTGANYIGSDPAYFNGPFPAHATIKLEDINKGLSSQILIGEKYLNPNDYTTGIAPDDNECLYVGIDNDTMRSTASPPLQDRPGLVASTQFGSAHPSGSFFIFADGSARQLTYLINPSVFQHLGDLKYTAPIPLP